MAPISTKKHATAAATSNRLGFASLVSSQNTATAKADAYAPCQFMTGT